MAVRIISETERNVFEYDGSKFFYRRISVTQSLAINKRHTKRGIIDHTAAGLEIVQWCLLGWENVEDEQGQEIPYSAELVRCLPDELVNELTVALRESSPADKALGNSSAS